MPNTLVIDQGTHASRAMLFSPQGEILSTSEYPVKLIKKDLLCIEQNPEEILQSVIAAIKDILDKSSNSIECCALATQRSTMLAWDRTSRQSLYPALNWQDRRSENDLQQFKQKTQQIQKITGLPLSPHYGAGKFRWLLNHLKEQQSSLSLGPLVSYLLCHLTAEQHFLVDHSNAQRTLLFDLQTLDWSDELLELFNINKTLLPLCKPVQHHYGNLLDTGIPITSVSGDQNAALFSEGKIPDKTAIINLGTGAFILHTSNKLHDEHKLLQGIARSNGHTEYLLEGTVNGAGAALSWASQQWPVADLFTQLPAWLDSIQQPPIFINSIGGLGSPWWLSEIEPGFINTGKQTSIEQRYVAIIESIVFLIQHNLEQLANHFDIRTLRVSGGLSQLDGLCQKLANLSGCQVERMAETEATARGAAWLAANCPQDWPVQPPARIFKPAPGDNFYKRYQYFTAEISRF